jgi:hypothetical protein
VRLELVDGIEPSTSPLPRECSTTELHEPNPTAVGHPRVGGSAPTARRAWSGRRDSNPRHSAWEADALPTELLPHTIRGLAPRRHLATIMIPPHLQRACRLAPERDGGQGWIRTSVGIRQRIYSPSPLTTRAPTHETPRGHRRRSSRSLRWSHPSESNRQPSDYKSGALPVELGWHPEGGLSGRNRVDPVRVQEVRLARGPRGVNRHAVDASGTPAGRPPDAPAVAPSRAALPTARRRGCAPPLRDRRAASRLVPPGRQRRAPLC